MDNEWKRIGNEYLFEKSVRDKGGHQITLLQSWKTIVALILHEQKLLIRTKKHYQYNITTSLDKLAKTQKLTNLFMDEKTFYSLLSDKVDEKLLFYNYDKDIVWQEYGDEEYEEYKEEEE